jgi:hypothetical protein
MIVSICRETGRENVCGKPAKWLLSWGTEIAMCDECCHLRLEDATAEEAATLTPIVPPSGVEAHEV